MTILCESVCKYTVSVPVGPQYFATRFACEEFGATIPDLLTPQDHFAGLHTQ